MSAERLKQLMQRFDKSPVDIAAGTKLTPRTVERLLKTGHCSRSTWASIERYFQDIERIHPEGKVAAG